MPPSEGPSAVPVADIVPSSPIAVPARARGATSPARAIVIASITAAPSPCAARAAISPSMLGAAPHATDATVNSAMPPSSSRRLPMRSPSRPAPTIVVVTAARYASTTHCTVLKLAPNASASVGRLELAMLVSSDGSSIARQRAAIAGLLVVFCGLGRAALGGVGDRHRLVHERLRFRRRPGWGRREQASPVGGVAVDARVALYACI